MTVNDKINAAFDACDIGYGETFRSDGQATTRIGLTGNSTVYVSDMRQGRGQNVVIDDAELLDVRVFTRSDYIIKENVAQEDLTEAIIECYHDLGERYITKRGW